MEQTTARLRKAFRYPSDNDSEDSLPEAIDEEEQDKLIQQLSARHVSSNERFARLFLALPAVAALPYPVRLLAGTAPPPPAFHVLALLSVSSLLCSAWSLLALPPGTTGFPALDRLAAHNVERPPRPSASAAPFVGGHPDKGPLELYLPGLNLLLAVLLAVPGLVVFAKPGEDEWSMFALGILPAVVYGAVLLAKMVMAGVDPSELERLRYRYKGA